MIEGEIKVGDRLIWEPKDPKAFESITVVEICGPMIRTSGKYGLFWRSEENIREVCTREKVIDTSDDILSAEYWGEAHEND